MPASSAERGGNLHNFHHHKRTQSNQENMVKLKVTRDAASNRAGKLGGPPIPGSASQSLYSQRPPEARGNRNIGSFAGKQGPAQAIAGEFSVLGMSSSAQQNEDSIDTP